VIPVAVLRTAALAGTDGPVLVLSGEADTTTVALLREVLAAQLEKGARLVTVDASGLSFVDSASLRVLILAARALHGRHGTLVFARPQPLVARLLEITGADQLLDVRELAALAGSASPGPVTPRRLPLLAVTSHYGCRASRSGVPGCRLPRPPPRRPTWFPGGICIPAREVALDA